MDKKSSILVGGALVGLGLFALMFLGVMSALGVELFGFVWRLWPALVLGVGLLFVVPPFLVRDKPGLGALFIPGMPILTTGGLLFLGSAFDAWGIWEWLWPMEIISLAMGFLFAAIYMRVIWLLIPAIIIGLNGFVFQFCATTGLWDWWAFLWTIEPFAVGLALLVVGVRRQSQGLKTAGLILFGVAGAGLMLMFTVLGGGWPMLVLGPVLLILSGFVVIAWGFLRSVLLPRSALE